MLFISFFFYVLLNKNKNTEQKNIFKNNRKWNEFFHTKKKVNGLVKLKSSIWIPNKQFAIGWQIWSFVTEPISILFEWKCFFFHVSFCVCFLSLIFRFAVLPILLLLGRGNCDNNNNNKKTSTSFVWKIRNYEIDEILVISLYDYPNVCYTECIPKIIDISDTEWKLHIHSNYPNIRDIHNLYIFP